MSARDGSHRIVLDWGTTSFRAALVDAAGAVRDRVESQDGIQSVAKGGFEAVLRARTAHWHAAYGQLPVVAAGMIGSRNGWVEMPYVEAPAGAASLARQMRRMALSTGETVAFIPGLTDRSASPFPDVMRGEETQLVGFGLDRDIVVVLPGTHSKWARIEGGRIASFRTFVTGEVFGALSRHSFLAQIGEKPPEPDRAALARGLAAALDPSRPDTLLQSLFTVRTGWLAGELQSVEVTDYLSGLIIGSEFRQAQASGWFRRGDALGIVGGAEIAEAYRVAAQAAGLSRVIGPPDASLRGCLALAALAEEMSDAT